MQGMCLHITLQPEDIAHQMVSINSQSQMFMIA